MTDNSEKRFELKDFAVIAPLLGSALAITYEVGSFVPLGYAAFGLFSLSEHLLWALAALPLVLAMLGSLVPIFASTEDRKFRQILEARRPDAGRRQKRFLKWSSVGNAVMAAFFLTLGWIDRSALMIALGIGLLMTAARRPLPHFTARSRKRRYSLVDITLAMFLMAGAVGFDLTRATLLTGCVSELTSKEGTKRATLIRSGERGALYFDKARNVFTFEKWDDLRSISWSHRSTLEQLLFFPLPIAKRTAPKCSVGPTG